MPLGSHTFVGQNYTRYFDGEIRILVHQVFGFNGMAPRVISVHCMKCSTKLCTYLKGGRGMLVKTFLHKIKRDYTLSRGVCPSCGSTFARAAVIKNKEANKIIGGKVYTKG